jgi:hypothetical protein
MLLPKNDERLLGLRGSTDGRPPRPRSRWRRNRDPRAATTLGGGRRRMQSRAIGNGRLTLDDGLGGGSASEGDGFIDNLGDEHDIPIRRPEDDRLHVELDVSLLMGLLLARVERERDVDGVEESDGFVGLVHPEEGHPDLLYVEGEDSLRIRRSGKRQATGQLRSPSTLSVWPQRLT